MSGKIFRIVISYRKRSSSFCNVGEISEDVKFSHERTTLKYFWGRQPGCVSLGLLSVPWKKPMPGRGTEA